MYVGGYQVLQEPLIRTGMYKHTAMDQSKISPITISALNSVQNTPWSLNRFVWGTLNEAFALGEDLKDSKGKTVCHIALPENPYNRNLPELQKVPQETWEAMSREEKMRFRGAKKRLLDAYDSEVGKYSLMRRTFSVASELADRDAFWFPHNMDFRSRFYPIPSDLNPQSNDMSKALLTFRDGIRIGETGVKWLSISVANAAGKDKLQLAERVLWTQSNEDLIRRIVSDPMKNREWLDMDEPFQFLAAAVEWAAMASLDNPEEFISHVPVQLDGTCNGAQHLSLMARDLIGAEATNCRDLDQRNDLYSEVAERVWKRVQNFCREGHPVALEIADQFQSPGSRRFMVKRSVMTVPYGVTEFGISQFMITDKHVAGMTSEWEAATMLRDLIMESIDETMTNGRELQVYFQTCARRVAEAGLPMQWDTPVGTKITQAYRTIISKRIHTATSRFRVYEEAEDVGMDVTKMATGAPPNVVHSCDAAHLQLTVHRMKQAGIQSFSMIHDSFGTHAAYVDLMRDLLRESAADMYSGDYLTSWKESVEEYSGVDLPEPPACGELDIEEVRKSTYFFS